MNYTYHLHKSYKESGQNIRLTGQSVPFFTFPILTDTGIVRHGFSTRMGGVSKEPYDTMNLSFTRGDRQEDVAENFRRIGDAIGLPPDRMVMAAQTHTTNIKIVTDDHAGEGVTRSRSFADTDGLVTNTPGLCLVTSYADCVPLYFVDPVRRVIGCSHAGWRGTVGGIGPKTVAVMSEHFGSRPEDIRAVIGPSICADCYQVGEDVADRVKDALGWREDTGQFLRPDGQEGKYRLDLWALNRYLLQNAGLAAEHITVSGLCTRCNHHLLFSHRHSGERRGNLCAFLALK